MAFQLERITILLVGFALILLRESIVLLHVFLQWNALGRGITYQILNPLSTLILVSEAASSVHNVQVDGIRGFQD